MIDVIDNIIEFDTLEAAREYVTETEPTIVNYATFYRASANLYVTTRIAAEGQLLGYGYDIMNK